MFRHDDDQHAVTWSFWRNAPIMSKGLLEPAVTLNASAMKIIEEIGEDTLPFTTSLTHTTNPAERTCQMGADAFGSLLRGMLGHHSSAGAVKPAALAIDLFAHTGDLGRAVLQEHFSRSLGGMHVYYLGFHADDAEACLTYFDCCCSYRSRCDGQVEWSNETHVQELSDKFMEGTYKPSKSLPDKSHDSKMQGCFQTW